MLSGPLVPVIVSVSFATDAEAGRRRGNDVVGRDRIMGLRGAGGPGRAEADGQRGYGRDAELTRPNEFPDLHRYHSISVCEPTGCRLAVMEQYAPRRGSVRDLLARVRTIRSASTYPQLGETRIAQSSYLRNRPSSVATASRISGSSHSDPRTRVGTAIVTDSSTSAPCARAVCVRGRHERASRARPRAPHS